MKAIETQTQNTSSSTAKAIFVLLILLAAIAIPVYAHSIHGNQPQFQRQQAQVVEDDPIGDVIRKVQAEQQQQARKERVVNPATRRLVRRRSTEPTSKTQHPTNARSSNQITTGQSNLDHSEQRLVRGTGNTRELSWQHLPTTQSAADVLGSSTPSGQDHRNPNGATSNATPSSQALIYQPSFRNLSVRSLQEEEYLNLITSDYEALLKPGFFKVANHVRMVDISQSVCLAQAMFYEARGEGLKGQVAVANVVINRATFPGYFPNSLCGVISERGQFQWYHNSRLRGKRNFHPRIDDEFVVLAKKIIITHNQGRRFDNTHGSYYFNANGKRMSPNIVQRARVGRHTFYTFKERWLRARGYVI